MKKGDKKIINQIINNGVCFNVPYGNTCKTSCPIYFKLVTDKTVYDFPCYKKNALPLAKKIKLKYIIGNLK